MKGTFFYKETLDSLLDIVGNTPVVRINKLVKDDWAEIYCKIEFFNPCGSVKDRICLSMIEAAEREGKLKKGDTIVEPTSGNTGIAYAMVSALKTAEKINEGTIVIIFPDGGDRYLSHEI